MNPYEILGLDRDCTEEDITKAFRELSKKHHPDVGGSSDVFIKISMCVEVLRDPSRRKLFDEQGIFMDQSGSSLEQTVLLKFKEILRAYVDAQLNQDKDINIIEFLDTVLSNAANNATNAKNEYIHAKAILTKRMEQIFVSEGPNIAHAVMQEKIQILETALLNLEKELLILNMIKEEGAKYSSIEEMQPVQPYFVVNQSGFTGMYQQGNTVFYRR